jgi:hypothetical protein
MSTEVRAPFQFFTDTDGNALESGYIYIGVEHLNPLASPLQSYWDSALTIQAYNVRTVSGYPAYGGSPGRLYVSGNYSILVKNRNLETVFMSLSMEGVLSYSDINLLSIKNSIEYGTQMFDILPNMEYRTPSEWDPLNPDDYFPRLCLTDFDTYKDISTANWPVTAISRLRDINIVFKQGLTGEISSPVVTNWAIAANVATLTFQNDADHIAYITALGEDEAQHGSYTNYRSVTLPSSIGDIAAGTYALTNINASTRQISFAFVAANNSGALASTVDFYAYRIAGSTTTARVFSARGLSLMGVNDANGYFVSGGLRRRGYFQGHWHTTSYFGQSAGSNRVYSSTGDGTTIAGNTTEVHARASVTDGTNGTPRTAKETHSPALSAHLYLHLGRYVA